MKIGDLVRFNHERDGGPVHRIVSVMSDGMVEINDMGGYFAPYLFTVADDIADIPPLIPNNTSILVTRLRGLALRMYGRVEAIEDRDGKDGAVTGRGIGIGYLLARNLAKALSDAADAIENPEPAQAGPTIDGGIDSANVSEGVTGGGERAVGDAAGKVGGHGELPLAGDPAASTLDPRDPDPSRPGIFRDHNCWKCNSGEKPCVIGNPRRCEYPHARND